jgi:A/G-specific adenine glycosylase
MQELRQELLKWYKNYKRDLPWRHTKNPYHIWLSEIILQQTRVAQGLPYYEKFIAAFPTVQGLAGATEQEVLALWQGLGYYSRGRNLHATAKLLASEHQGIFPNSYTGLLKLKGIGPYTAAAISSFAFDLPHAVVDGNVFRVLSRYFGIELAINSSQGKKIFESLAQDLLNEQQPALHNQAIMEFGALQCKPISPDCSVCPLQISCVARIENKVAALPLKEKKVKVRRRYFVFHVDNDAKQQLGFEKRGPGDIWEGLYQFPLKEFSSQQEQLDYLSLFDKQWRSSLFKHVLTHQKIEAYFILAKIEGETPNIEYHHLNEIQGLPLPRLIDKFLEQHREELPH